MPRTNYFITQIEAFTAFNKNRVADEHEGFSVCSNFEGFKFFPVVQ